MPVRFAKVVPGLFRGGVPELVELPILKDVWGVNKIISLDGECGENIFPSVKKLGMKHIILPLGDGRDPKIPQLKELIPKLLEDGPTYIHCRHGKDRTGMSVAMFRVHSGWKLGDALAEAFKFGMGHDLPEDSKQSYYDAVRRFAKEKEDTSYAKDAVTQTRETNQMGPIGTGLDDYTTPRTNRTSCPPHADIEFSQLSRIASGRVYCKCKSSHLLRPKTFWFSSKKEAEKAPTDHDGKLFSAKIFNEAITEKFDKPITSGLIHSVLMKDIDIGILRKGKYLVLVPSSLVDIHEEDIDVNEIFDPGDVGTIDRSTNNTYAYPGMGSDMGGGGMPDGAAGVVQLPFGSQI